MLTSKSKHACMYSILSLTSKALNQGVTDRFFFTSGRDGSGTCKKVRVLGRVGRSSEKS